MSDSGKEDQETYSAAIMKKVQQTHIRIKCLQCNTVPIITANLHEACNHDGVNCSTAAGWFKQFQEGRRFTKDDAHTSCPYNTIDCTSIAIVSTLLYEDRQMMVQEMEPGLTMWSVNWRWHVESMCQV